MASRAPLLIAAALFFVGVAGLLATVPGREVGRSFVPLVRGGSNSTPKPESDMNPTVPSLAFSIPLASVTTEATAVDAATPPPTATAAPPTATPTPAFHAAVVAAVASDVSPTPIVPRPIMVSADGPEDSGHAGGVRDADGHDRS